MNPCVERCGRRNSTEHITILKPQIRRSTFLHFTKFVDQHISGLSNEKMLCEEAQERLCNDVHGYKSSHSQLHETSQSGMDCTMQYFFARNTSMYQFKYIEYEYMKAAEWICLLPIISHVAVVLLVSTCKQSMSRSGKKRNVQIPHVASQILSQFVWIESTVTLQAIYFPPTKIALKGRLFRVFAPGEK